MLGKGSALKDSELNQFRFFVLCPTRNEFEDMKLNRKVDLVLEEQGKRDLGIGKIGSVH